MQHFVFGELFSFFIAHPREEEVFEAEVGEEGGVGLGVTERVKHPANFWPILKLIPKEFLTHPHIDYHVFIVGTCLIRGSPATLRNLELTVIE